MKPPRVYRAIAAVAAEIGKLGVGKTGTNRDDGYAFRSIDDVVAAVSPLLARHRLCVLPRIAERTGVDIRLRGSDRALNVTVRGAFEFVCASDGSSHTVETFGEATDASDKATSKAMTAAYKYALVQTFCIPVRGIPDADVLSPRTAVGGDIPVQGWEQWAVDLTDLVTSCESCDALDRVRATYVTQLRLLAATERGHFDQIGSVFAEKRSTLRRTVSEPPRRDAPAAQSIAAQVGPEHAAEATA